MTFEQKIDLLKTDDVLIGCPKRVLFPPLYRLQRSFGIKSPPPIFQSFARNAWTFGTFFGLFWSVSMLATAWQIHPISLPVFISAAIMSGLMFGLTIAWSLQRTRKRFGVGSWDDFWAFHEGRQEAQQGIPPNDR
jgi:hypothetical protein